MERRFAASVDRVFRAWSDPADLVVWAWGTSGDDVLAEVDFRPGGAYRISTLRPNGTRWSFYGVYQEIESDHRLSFTLRWDAPMGYPSVEERVTVELAADQGGTRMDFVHEGVPGSSNRDGHIRGWANTFDTLARHLEARKGGS
jgi:uncharacterized protein YndB with AHSA1/START domain